MSERKPSIVMFRVATVLLPLIALLLLEGVLRLVPGLDADRYIDIGPFNLLSEVQVNGVPHYRVSHPSVYEDRNIVFPVEKPAGSVRIFCLGGSASAGWPHPPMETAVAYLERALQQAYSPRPVQVINISAHGFASYRVRSLFDRVLDLDPDLIMVYSGNNEFLEPRDYNTSGLRRILDTMPFELRIVALLRRLTRRAVLSGTELADLADVFWNKVQQEAIELRSDPDLFAKVTEHYGESMAYMAGRAAGQDVPLLLLTVPVNLRDWEPNVSAPVPSGPEGQNWRAAWKAGRGALLRGDAAQAVDRLREATLLHPEDAETHFWLGRAEEMTEDWAAAAANYTLAKDLDLNPFRAHSDFNVKLRELGTERAEVHVVDLERDFATAAKHRLPGFEWFIDYVHPTQRGNLFIAQKVFTTIVEGGLLPWQPPRREFQYVEARYGSGETYDERVDLRLQQTVFSLCCMNHQYDAAISHGRYLVDLITNRSAEIRGMRQVPTRPSDEIIEGITAFSTLRDVEDREFLGEVVPAAERLDAEQLIADFYAEWFKKGRF